MDMSMDMHMDMNDPASSGHSMVFVISTTTPLLSSTFAPTTTGSYAGACIFLIILATTTRLLWAFKGVAEGRWLHKGRKRRYVVVKDSPTEVECSSEPIEGTLVKENGVEEKIRFITAGPATAAPWRMTVDLPRAALSTFIIGLDYLLMLAVMTMNVGYFLSALAGLFLGELAVGRFGASGGHHPS